MSKIYLKEWVRKAEEDYEAALTLNRQRKRQMPNAASFHCQQCVEKYLKAFLVMHEVQFPKTHDLLELHKLCISVNPTFERIGDLLDILNPYTVEFRYPGEEVAMEEVEEAIRVMKKVRKFILNILEARQVEGLL